MRPCAPRSIRSGSAAAWLLGLTLMLVSLVLAGVWFLSGENAAVAGASGSGTHGDQAQAGSPLALLEGDALADAKAEEVVDVSSTRTPIEGAAALVEAEPELTFSGVVLEVRTAIPVVGARLVLRDREHEAETESDAEGRFELSWPAGRAASLEVLHESYADLRRPDVDLEAVASLRLGRSARVQGLVTGSGVTAFDAAAVHLWHMNESSNDPVEESEVDDVGRFTFDDLEPGTYAVAATLPGGLLSFEGGIELELGESRDLLLEVAPGATLRGRVLDRAGAPVEGARLEATTRAQGLRSSVRAFGAFESTSAADGSYELIGLSPGTNEIGITPPWGGSWNKRVEIARSGASVERDFVLHPPASVSGSVVDPAGKAVPGATVFCANRTVFEKRLRRWQKKGVSDEGSGWGALDWRVAECDAQGRFQLDGLPFLETWRAAALPPASGGLDEENPEAAGMRGFQIEWKLRSGQARKDMELVLAEGLFVNGRTFSDDGRPLPGVSVCFASSRDGYCVESDGEGRFRLGPIFGRGRLSLTLDGYQSAYSFLRTDNPPEGELEFALGREYELSGWILDPEGNAIPHARIRASSASRSSSSSGATSRPSPGRRSATLRKRSSTRADEFGRYRLGRLAAGDWSVRASALGFRDSSTVVTVPDESFQVLTLLSNPRLDRASVFGRVVVKDEGRAPDRLRFDGLRGGTVEVDDGRFEIRGMQPGPLSLRIKADHCADRLVRGQDLLPGARLDLGELDLEPSTPVTVVIEGVEPAAALNLKVRLVPLAVEAGGAGKDRPSLPFTSEAKQRRGGRPHYFSHSKVPRYPWRLVVQGAGYKTLKKKVTIQPRGRQTVKVKLAADASRPR